MLSTRISDRYVKFGERNYWKEFQNDKSKYYCNLIELISTFSRSLNRLRILFVQLMSSGWPDQSITSRLFAEIIADSTVSSTNTSPVISFESEKYNWNIILVYLTSTSTARNLQLIFSLGSAPTVDRAWRLKISLLPCYVDYLGKFNIYRQLASSQY